MNRSGPSAADVARLAGVSASAVSRVLRPGGSASKAVRAKVHAAASQLGYHPNAMARAMTTRRSEVIAIIMSAETAIYYPEVLKELTLAIGRQRLRTMVFMLENAADASDAVSQILSYQVDGVVVLAFVDPAALASLRERRVPVVLYNQSNPDPPVATVNCDHQESGRRLAQYMLGLGHRMFGLIEGPLNSAIGAQRILGARSAIENSRLAGVGANFARGDYSYASGRHALEQLMAGEGRIPTAVIAANDMMALGALDCARIVLGIAVPEAMSIAGFDGIGATGWEGYCLTTMRQPVRRMSQAAIEMLDEQIRDPRSPIERRLFATQFVEGATVRNAPRQPYKVIAA